jgi:hypothetical protein
MSRERLQIFFRRRQLFNDSGPVVVQCTGFNSAEYVPGTVDQTWVNMTDFVKGVEKLQLSWDYINSNDSAKADTNPGGSNYDKGISADVTLNDRAFQFVHDWLEGTPCGVLNAVEVLIVDELCKRNFRTFEIKADNLGSAPFDAPCEYEVKLREADPVWHCVHKTFIWDNWQHWFEDNSTKQHPCFLTAVEPRPRLISSVRMGISIFGQTIPVVSLLFSENDNVFRRILDVDNFVEAPLIRDLISNVADKCGLQVDTIFHDPDGVYYNLCLYYPSNGVWHVNDADDVESPALWFHLANRWDITVAELLDKLKPVFKCEWYVTPNSTLVFRPKQELKQTAPILDFTTGQLALWNLKYDFDGTKKPAYGRYSYQIDPSDLATQEMGTLYNDIVDFDGPANNAMLEGSSLNNFEFAATGFVRDGRAEGDYMRDLINDGETVAYALVIVLGVIIAALLAGVLSAAAGAALAAFLVAWAASIASKANDLRDLFGGDTYTGAVRITSDQVGTPRLLLWDAASLERAKVVRIDPADIDPNPFYNPDLDPYTDVNKFQYNPVGGLFIFNYPMYFDSFFLGNLYDRYSEQIDNPLLSLDTHQTFEMYTDNCCEVLDALGVFEGQAAQIGSNVKLEERGTYDNVGRIEHFEVDYESERITLRGKVSKLQT